MRVKQFAESLDAVVTGLQLESTRHEQPISDANDEQEAALDTLEQETFYPDHMALLRCFVEEEDR